MVSPTTPTKSKRKTLQKQFFYVKQFSNYCLVSSKTLQNQNTCKKKKEVDLTKVRYIFLSKIKKTSLKVETIKTVKIVKTISSIHLNTPKFNLTLFNLQY